MYNYIRVYNYENEGIGPRAIKWVLIFEII